MHNLESGIVKEGLQKGEWKKGRGIKIERERESLESLSIFFPLEDLQQVDREVFLVLWVSAL